MKKRLKDTQSKPIPIFKRNPEYKPFSFDDPILNLIYSAPYIKKPIHFY